MSDSSDPFDQASRTEELFLKNALTAALAIPVIIPVINCKENCGENIPHGKACSFYKDCLEDWELNNRMKKERPVT